MVSTFSTLFESARILHSRTRLWISSLQRSTVAFRSTNDDDACNSFESAQSNVTRCVAACSLCGRVRVPCRHDSSLCLEFWCPVATLLVPFVHSYRVPFVRFPIYTFIYRIGPYLPCTFPFPHPNLFVSCTFPFSVHVHAMVPNTKIDHFCNISVIYWTKSRSTTSYSTASHDNG